MSKNAPMKKAENRLVENWALRTVCVLFTICIVCLAETILRADAPAQAPPTNEELLKRIEAMEAQIKSLQSQLQQYQQATNAPPTSSEFKPGSLSSTQETPESGSKRPWFGLGYRSEAALRIGSYGELKFGRQDTPTG